MIVSSPIYHSRANRTVCRHGHRPRNSGQAVRGNCVLFLACRAAGCSEHALGVQCTELDIVVWYSLTRTQYEALNRTDPATPPLTLLHLAGYYDETDATQAA